MKRFHNRSKHKLSSTFIIGLYLFMFDSRKTLTGCVERSKYETGGDLLVIISDTIAGTEHLVPLSHVIATIYQKYFQAQVIVVMQVDIDDGVVHYTGVYSGVTVRPMTRPFLALDEGCKIAIRLVYIRHLNDGPRLGHLQ